MKKYLILFLFNLIISFAYSQTIENNLNRYWHYRDRLEEKYMIVGMPEKQGTNWPAGRRFLYGIQWLGSGENPTQPFAEYLCVLATEYRLLKDYGEDEHAAETLQKIAWALESFDRTDLNAEKFFRARISNPPLNDNDPDFWQKIDNHIIFPQDLNGFFLRGDWDGQCVDDGPWHECMRNLDEPSPGEILYPINPNANILDYNNGQLKNAFPNRTIHSTEAMFNSKVVKSNNRSIESQDEVWALLLGLAFIEKLVDDPATFTDLLGHQVTVKKWSKNIAYRTVLALSFLDFNLHRRWWLRNPVTNEWIATGNGGGTIALSYLFAKAGNKICGDDYSNLQTPGSILAAPLSLGIFPFNVMGIGLTEEKINITIDMDYDIPGLTDTIHSIPVRPFGSLNLAMIAGQFNLGYYFNLYQFSSFLLGISSNERLPAIYSILNDADIEEELGADIYNSYKDNFLYILNQATDCGPWIKQRGVENLSEISNNYWWRNRLGDVNTIFYKPSDLINEPTQYANGLDYMFLHNLYWLTFMKPPETYDLTMDFPFEPAPNFWIGNDKNPYTVEQDYINATNTINPGGNVTYKATYEVRLKKGFRVYDNATFKAFTTSNSHNQTPLYTYRDYNPYCEYIFDKDLSEQKKNGIIN
ncbi:MAG: hypothetical protein L3J35_13100 [Bacteroidales bacterium]|nr:hypothetical protein [Bacteroidales bacterium]